MNLSEAERRTLAVAVTFSALTVFAAYLYVKSQAKRYENTSSKPERFRRAASTAKKPAQLDGDNVPRFDSSMGWLRRNSTPSASAEGSPLGVLSEHSDELARSSDSRQDIREDADGDQLSDGGGSLPRALSKQSSARRGGRGDPFGPDSPLGDWSLQLKDLQFVKRPDGSDWHLGAGSYGNVYKAMKDGVSPVAVKVFPSNATDVQLEEFQREVVILKSCRDRHVVQFLGACIEDGQTFLVTEYMEGGDLFNALHKHNASGLTWYRRDTPGQLGLGQRIALDIACGLNFLHTHRIVHMDVKSPNVLLGQNSTAKLADVGLAKFMHKDYLSAAKSVGTFAWSAPEVLMGGRCSEKVDIFSYGVVLWELVTGESPVRGRLRPVRVPDECPEWVRDLIAACMDASPAERPSARDIVDMLSSSEGKGLKQKKPGRKRPSPEVGPCSGKVLDMIIRHASVVGVADYTRADALQAAALKDGLRLWKAYVAELLRVMPDEEAPAPGTAQHARLLELVASMRRLLAIFLAEHMTTMRELRNVNVEKAAPDTTTDSQPREVVASTAASVIGKREVVSWRQAADCVRLSAAQAAAVAEARTTVGARLTELAEQRKHLISSLNAFAAGPNDGGDLDTAVNASEQLQRNMAEENSLTHEFQYWFLCNVLSPVQEARLELVSRPYYPDCLAITDLLVEDAIKALANARITSS